MTVIGPSEAEPRDGDTDTHDSDDVAVQSRLAVKEMEPLLLPSALSSMLAGLERVSDGAF